jgi:2-polyprenyl-3-methyl-5-hydroxy-6-metoxy-1,4-benzoquinol methylase
VGAVRRRQAREILPLIRSRVDEGSDLLHVGCSFGFFLAEARRAGFQVHGIEPDRQAAARANELLGGDVVELGSFSAETARSRSADVISMLDVLEHIPPDELGGFVGSVRKTLRPSGLWVIKVPSTEGLYYRLSHVLLRIDRRLGASFVERLWQTRYEFPHLVYFDRRTLSMWLQGHGFEVVAHRYLQEVPLGTIVDRLTTDRGISRPLAYVLAPSVLAVNAIEWIRGRSDSLVVFARPRAG